MIAVLFPGQGSQYVGMGKELSESFSISTDFFKQANDILNFDLSSICFQGPAKNLNETTVTQPAVFTVSVIFWEILKSFGFESKYFTGHSLGEYTALYAANAFDFATALRLVSRRAFFMQKAVSLNKGAMAAVIGLQQADVENSCLEAASKGLVEIANLNSDDQIVISGEKNAVDVAANLCEAKGAKKIVFLDVSVPSHSSLLKDGAQEFSLELNGIIFRDLQAKVVANVSADYYQNDIKDFLVKQIYNRVKWKESILRLINDGATTFVEVGPGRVLSGLARRINRNINILNVEDKVSLEKTLEVLNIRGN
jgi:[acyl-carrier-protein] S-malonyltransferase